MSQKQSKLSDILFTLVGALFILFLYGSITHEEPPVLLTGVDLVGDMWKYESSPSDRRTILEGLSAMECIDAGICELVSNYPIAE